jgi:hypothetical protein
MSYFIWPKGKLIMMEPQLGIMMCEECWNKRHIRGGCQIPGCECGCYIGRNKGLSKPHPPAKGCEDNQTFPDVGSITV